MRLKIIMALVVAAGLVLLAACGGAPEGAEKTVYVAPTLADCVGVAPQQCMQVSETGSGGPFILFYDQIEGFDYEEGFAYELVVREEAVENPPADGSSIRWVLVEEVSKTPVAATDGDGATTGEDETAGDETAAGAGGEVVTVFVGPEMVDCVGEGPQTCMLVKTDPNDEYGLFYNPIAGFTFEPGFEYELRLRVEPVENPPAGGSSLQYTLVEEVSRAPVGDGDVAAGETAATVEAVAETPLEGTLWTLQSYQDDDGNVQTVVPGTEVTAQFAAGQVSGNTGCNNYGAGYEVNANNISIGQAASTLAACVDPAAADQERAFLGSLQAAATFEISGDTLTLRGEAGNDLLVFQAVEEMTFEGRDWVMVNYFNESDAIASVLLDTEITARFEDGQVGGSAGCNSYSAGYELDGNNISIGPAAATQIFCAEPEGIMDQELAYLTALQSAASYEIGADGALTFFNTAGDIVLLFQESEQPEPAGLAGAEWTLASFVSGDTVSSVLNGAVITIMFAEDGMVNGLAGCNNYFGSYESEGNNLTIGALGATRILCNEPAGIMAQETLYLSQLDAARGFEIEGDTLTLFDDQGNALLIFSTGE